MSETAKKTPEEELLSKVGAGEGGSGEKTPEKTGSGDGDANPEKKLIEELQAKLDESERRSKIIQDERDAERLQKDAARRQAGDAAVRAIQTQEESVKSHLNAAKSGYESAQKEWDDAFDSGDKTKLRVATEKLNDAQMKMRGAEFADQRFTENKEKMAAAATGGRFSKRTQEWVDKHPRYNTDKKYKAACWAADEDARSSGLEPDTDEYFTSVEKYLKDVDMADGGTVSAGQESKTDPAPGGEKTDPNTPKKKDSKISTGAPPNGAAGSSGGGRQETVVLTSEEQEAAAFTWPEEYKKDPKATLEKYARLKKERESNPRYKR